MKKAFLFILVVTVINIHPQRTSAEAVTITTPAGYTLGLLNESGTSGIYNNVSNITFVNPAAISEFKKYSFGLSYQLQSRIDEAWYADIGLSRINNFIPQSAGVVIPFNNMRFGIGMGQIYNGSLEIGEILVTTTINPDGTGETFIPVIETTVQNYSFLFSYSLEKLFADNSDFTLGFKISLNRLNYFQSFYQLEDIDESAYEESWSAGAVYNINFTKNKRLRFGLAFESEIEFSKKIEIKSSVDTTGIGGLHHPPGFYGIASVDIIMRGKVPGRLLFDAEMVLSQQLKVLGNVTNIFWNSISDLYEDQLEFSGSIAYSFSRSFSSSIGAYYTNRKRTDNINAIWGVEDKLDALFLTAGINIKYSFLDIGLAFADSHLASSSFRKQTILKLIVGANIN